MFIEKISRDVFLKSLQMVSGVVERKQPLPILSNVLLEKKNDELHFLATDLEIQIETRLPYENTGQSESITVPARKLQDVLRVLPDGGLISLDIKESKLQVKLGKSKFSLQTLPPQDFPRMNEQSGKSESVELPQKELKTLLECVQYAMALQDIRYYLNGVLMVLENNKIKLVATDGHRLAYACQDFEYEAPKKEVILSRKTVSELSKLLTENEQPIKIEFMDKQVRIGLGNTTITSKVIDGKFPDYERVIPEYDNHLDLERLALVYALQRVAVLSNEKFRGVRFVLTEKNLKIISNNSEQEEAQEEIDTDYHGPALDIGFNVNYLLDGIQCVGSEKIRLSFGDSNSSLLITVPEKQNFKYVVMPMRI